MAKLISWRWALVGVAGVGLLIFFGWYGGWREIIQRQTRVEVTEEAARLEPPCDQIYTDLKEALIAAGQKKGPVCGLDISGKKYLELTRGLLAMKELRLLDASDNIIRDVPDWIGEMTQLQVLDLSQNRITILPGSLGQLKSLKVLDIRGNTIPQDQVDAVKSLLPEAEVKF